MRTTSQMLPTDTTLRTIIDEREQEIAGALRRVRLLRQARESRTPRTAGPLRSWLSGVLRGHRGRDLRHALAHPRR